MDDVKRFTTIIRGENERERLEKDYTILDRQRVVSPLYDTVSYPDQGSKQSPILRTRILPALVGNKARLFVALPFTLSVPREKVKSQRLFLCQGFVFFYVPHRRHLVSFRSYLRSSLVFLLFFSPFCHSSYCCVVSFVCVCTLPFKSITDTCLFSINCNSFAQFK